MGHRPQIGIGQDVLPGGHRGAADAGCDRAVDVLERLAAAQFVESEVGGEDLHAVVAVLRDREVEIAAHLAQLHLRQLLGEVVDLLLGRVGGMAGGRALGQPVIDAPAALDPVGLAIRPGIRRRDDRLAGLVGAPARREGLHVLDEIVELGGGDVPRQHRGAVQAVAQRAHEVGVAGQLAGRHRGELVDAQAQIARRRAQARGGRALPVARVAVTRPAEVRVHVAPMLQRARRDVAAAERDRRREGRGRPRRAAARRRREAERGGDQQRTDGARVHARHTATKTISQTTATKSM